MFIRKKKREQPYLLIGYTAFGDRIAQIPYLLKLKNQNKKVYLVDYSKGWVNYSGNMNSIYNFMKHNQLYEDTITIPYGFLKIIIFFFKVIIPKFYSYEYVYLPVGTKIGKILGKAFSKKVQYTFKNNDDNSKYNSIVEGMLNQKNINFYSYSKELKIPYSSDYKEKYGINKSFITVFVGPYTGSLKPDERTKLFDYIINQGKKIVLLGGNSKDREGWILDYINNYDGIINILGRTNFEELCSIITDADYTISANGGIMWLSHLLNKKSISFSIMSGKILHPPIDNENSFHIQSNICSRPCEFRVSKRELEEHGFRKCIYYGTKKEAVCRNIGADIIINILNNY